MLRSHRDRGAAFAHHGPGTFELSKTVSFTAAKLTKIELLNPHRWLYFETTEPDGKGQEGQVTKEGIDACAIYLSDRAGQFTTT